MEDLDITESKCLSHLNLDFDNNIVEEIKERLQNSTNLSLSIEDELNLLQQLTEFELGRFLLQNKGLNGYWTNYIISGGHSEIASNPLEGWLLNKAPIVKATQERFKIFQKEIQKRISSNMSLASIPCGLMDDLLSLDYSNLDNINITGIDIDSESIELAKDNIKFKNDNVKVNFELNDAWLVNYENKFDLLTSNGLNIYEPDNPRIFCLYKNFYNALKPNGYLITSFLTPPPTINTNSTWKDFNINELIKQKAIFADIIQAGWQVFRTEKESCKQLESVGFKIIDVIYDSQGMFPTIIAQK